MAGKEEDVKLIGSWASPFSRRVEIKSPLKGVPYDYFDEDYLVKTQPLNHGGYLSSVGVSELNRWIKKLNEVEIVRECIPPKAKHIERMYKIVEKTKST